MKNILLDPNGTLYLCARYDYIESRATGKKVHVLYRIYPEWECDKVEDFKEWNKALYEDISSGFFIKHRNRYSK